MKNFIVKISLLIILALCSYKMLLSVNNKISKEVKINNYINDINNNIYGYIKINKINLLEILNDINSKDNNLNKGLFIYNKNPLIIMGHSGRGKLALFNDLDKLEIGDIILIDIENKFTNYKVSNIKYKNKVDDIIKNSDLILVTCDKKDMTKQLVIEAKKCSNC